MIATAVVAGLLLFGAAEFFTGRAGAGWMVALEEHGWFSAHQYKRSLGVRVRRLTILGILIVGGSGAYSLWSQGVLPDRLDDDHAVRRADAHPLGRGEGECEGDGPLAHPARDGCGWPSGP